MQTVVQITILCVFCMGHIYGEEFYGIFDMDPSDLDQFEEDLIVDRDIFKGHTEGRTGMQTIKRLCNEYDILLDNQKIDCSRIKLIQRPPESEENIQKRAAEDAPLEGSGNGYEKEQESDIPPSPDVSRPNKESDGESDQRNSDIKYIDDGISTIKPIKEYTDKDAKTNQEITKLPVVDDVKEDLQVSTQEVTSLPSEKTESTSVFELVLNGDKSSVENTNLKKVTENQGTIEKTTVASVVKKGRKLLLGDIETDKSRSPNEENSQKTNHKSNENIHEYQSGNAIIENTNGATIDQYEHAVNSMASNAKIKVPSSNGEEPTSGESAKEANVGRKDTKVLIILFVAVVVIGGAAFAYNFIKKRKQTKAHTPREQNGDGNVIKRSLQNLTGQATKSDPEQGTEMKPLMKTLEKKTTVAEYKNENTIENTAVNK